MEKYIDEEMLNENINRKIFYLVDANSFVAKDSSDYTTIQFNQVEIMNEKGYSSSAIDCSIDLYDDEIIYLSAAQIGYISPSQGIWNPSIMTVKKTKISMKPFIRNEDIICMRKNGKVSYHTQFASAAIVKTYNKLITNWDEYNDESEEYVISASLGYTLNSSVIELYEKRDTLDCSILILEDRTDVLDSSILILESRIDDLDSSVSNYQSQFNTVNDNMTKINENIEKLNSSVSYYRTEFNSVYGKMTKINEKIEKLDSSVSALKKEVEDLKNNSGGNS